MFAPKAVHSARQKIEVMKRIIINPSGAVVLVGSAIIAMLAVMMYLSAPKINNVKLIGADGSKLNITLPFYAGNFPTGRFIFKGTLESNYYTQGMVRIIPDDHVLSIRINNRDVPLDSIDEARLRDYENGFYVNLAPYLQNGENTVEITVKNYGGRFGLSLYSEINTILVETAAAIFILCLVFVLLIREIPLTKESFNTIVFIIVGTIAALILRYMIFKKLSVDYYQFLSPWVDYIKQKGFIGSFKERFSDYTPLYLYLLAFSTTLPVQKVIAIKVVSVPFDFIGAIYAYKIVRENYAHNDPVPAMTYVIFLFAPTVVINGSFWGQCDILYSAFCIISIYSIIKKRALAGMIFYGIALSLKLQAVFLIPIYILLWIRREISFKYTLIIPAVYFLTLIPSIFAGRSIQSLLLIYLRQAGSYKSLTLNAPTVYQWFPNSLFQILNPSGIFYAGCIVFIILFLIWMGLRSRIIHAEDIIQLAMFFALAIPFLLPKMHERYFFLADVIALPYAFYFPKYFYMPIIVWLVSFFSYGPFLLGMEIVPIRYLSLVLLFIIGVLMNNIGKKYIFGEAVKTREG